MAIDKDVLDRLLAGRDPQELFAKDGLLDELKKALAERMLSADLRTSPALRRPAPVGRDGRRRLAEDLDRRARPRRVGQTPGLSPTKEIVMTDMERKGGVPVWRAVGTTPLPAQEEDSANVVIVGASPVGLTIALDLGQRGHRVTVLNKLDFVAAGSKAICFAKRTLDIWDRLGVGAKMVERGVEWNVGKVFRGGNITPIYSCDMLPIKHQKMPGFINLQQYHAEEILLEAGGAAQRRPAMGHKVGGLTQGDARATATVRSRDGEYRLQAPWLVACDGSRSPIRGLLGLDFNGRVFEDNFLIADVRMKGERPSERWFWFDPPSNGAKSALLHKQPDDVWRLDFQLGWDIDREACIKPENVAPYVRGMLGDHVEFEPEWYSVYTFQCRRMQRFIHDRVIFAGNSAHLVSPFGARGCNGGVADADNLGWKLDLVLSGAASAELLESYNDEAIATADENILNSTRSTDFMTPKNQASQALRDAVLELAEHHAFARPFVNSGRLSTAVRYLDSRLATADAPVDKWAGITPGSVALDAPTSDNWLLSLLSTGTFTLLSWQADVTVPAGVAHLRVEEIGDPEGLIVARYDLQPGSAYLIRPDHYVSARWRRPSTDTIGKALRRAQGRL